MPQSNYWGGLETVKIGLLLASQAQLLVDTSGDYPVTPAFVGEEVVLTIGALAGGLYS